MKKLSILAVGVVAGLCALSPVDATAQYVRRNDRGRGDQVCVYKDINYQGAEQCYRAGDEVNDLGAQRKSISSIRVYGRGTVTVYENKSFRGHSAQFTSDVSDLGHRMMAGNTAWSDHIDSLRVSETSQDKILNGNDRRSTGDFGRDQSQQPRDGICVYDRPNYQGRSECWSQGQSFPDLRGQGNWNQQISSIRVFGRAIAVVYQNIGYRGESLTVDDDIPDLSAIRAPGNGNNNGRGRGNPDFRNWAFQISSLQVQSQRQNR
jgi:peptidase inhibitor family I36